MSVQRTPVEDQKLERRAYLILSLLLVGNISTASVITIMGYYIVSVLGMDPWAISVYMLLVTAVSVGLNRWFGSLIDRGADIRQLVFASVFCFCCASLLLNVGVSFGWLLVLVAPLFALANSSLSVMYTFGRLYAERQQLNITKYNAFLRMSTSSGWIIGPGITFGLLSLWGIKASFMASLLLGVIWMALWAITLPVAFKNTTADSAKSAGSGGVSLKLRIASLACVCFAATNVLFTASMPIYVIEELQLPAFAPGMSFAIKCFVEIPAIYFGALLAARWGDRLVLMFSAFLAVVVMYLMTTINSLSMLAIFAALEGVYYGLFAGTMVGFMQSFADGRMGRATSIYVSSLFVGGMVGSISVGVVASAYGFIGGVYLAMFSGCLSFIVVYFLKYVKSEPVVSVLK